MKNEDTQKPLREGKKDYAIEKILKGCLLSLFFVSSFFAQTKLNNSLFFNTLNSKPNLNRFNVFDFNEDGVYDFVLYGSARKEIVIHRSLRDSSISNAINKFFYYPVTEIRHIKKREDFGSFYLVLSEQNKLAALTSFTKYGTLLMLNKLKFKYAPSGLRVLDFNKDGAKEIYVYGHNFKGIYALTINNFILQEKPVTEEGVYVNLVPVDFNYDDYTDLLGYELFDNNLVFFRNESGVNFLPVRKKRLPFNPEKMLANDYNSDGYTDIAFTYANKISIFLGDSVSSFNKLYTKSLPFNIAKVFEYKANGDNFVDFLFISEEDSSLAISINKNGKVEDPVKLITGEQIVDVKTIDGRISALSAKGKIFTQLNIKNKTDKSFLLADDLFNDMNSVNLTNLISFPFKNTKEHSIVLAYGRDKLDSFGYYAIEGNCAEISSIASRKNDYHFIYNTGQQCLELLRTNKSRWKVYKRMGVFQSGILGVLPIYRDNNLFGGMISKDSTGTVKMDAIDLFSNSKSLLNFADTTVALEVLSGESFNWDNILIEDANKVKYVYALDKSAKKDTVRIELKKKYYLASQIKGKYFISKGNLIFYYAGKKTAEFKLMKKHDVNLWNYENITYYEIDGLGQYLFINIPELYRMYWVKVDLVSGRNRMNTLIDSKKIIKYIVRRIHNKMFLFYKTTDFDKIMVRELE